MSYILILLYFNFLFESKIDFILITYDKGKLTVEMVDTSMSKRIINEAGIAFTTEESVVDLKRVAITVALFETATLFII